MKTTAFKNCRVVRSSWLEEGGRRLDCNPYMSGAMEAREALRLLAAPKQPLSEVTTGIFHAGREGRLWVNDPKFGVPFLGSSDILCGDLSKLPLISKKRVERNPLFTIGERWTLISRSGTIGRMAYARPDMAGIACSEHVLRVVPDPENIPPGYLYAYLSSKFGVPLVISGTYGAIIQHIEPEHISSLPVPRFDKSLELDVHNKIEDAAKLLSEYQRQLSQSTKDVFESVGLKDITASEWHKSGSDVGFLVEKPKVWSFRALNYNPRYLELVKHIKSVPNKSLDEICLPGSVARGGRFKRIDAAPDHAYRMIGQKELFWLKPEGRWVARTAMDIESLGIPYATMVAAQGTLGESEMYCRAEFVYGSWTEMAFSEHILRIVADEKIMPRGFLFAYMRSETVFRILRSISVGSKLQDHHYKLRGEIPVPFPDHDIQLAIHKRVIDAYEKRHRAMALMDEAVQLVERYIGRNEH